MLVGVDDKSYQDKLYRVAGFTFGPFKKTELDLAKDPAFPKGFSVSPNRKPLWTEDLAALSFGIHEPHKKKKGGAPAAEASPKPDTPDTPDISDTPDSPDLLVWHFKDKRLAPMQAIQERADKNHSCLSASPTTSCAKSHWLPKTTSQSAATTPLTSSNPL